MKIFYSILCLLGVLLPYGVFVPWAMEHGLNIGLFVSEASSTRIGSFAWLDVLVSAVVVIGFILVEGIRQKMNNLWLPVVGIVVIGVSFGLPLFLLMREIHIEKQNLSQGNAA